DPDQSWTIRSLKNLGVDLAALSQKAGLRAETPTLDRLGRDLSMLAREGKLDPMFGRKKELRLLVRTLARKRKNNPVMTGEAGVGKTAIVEGLAQKAESGRVPILVGKRIVEISAAGLVAGTKYRGKFAEQMLKLIEEIKQDGNIVLFIDELHTILGAGRVKGGALDAGNILKPALARGELSVIGATTTEEYERYIASDAALERRFEPILVKEPTKAETKKILMGAKKEYEKHHEVTITEEAVDACVELSMRYLPDHNLPDKAIALMDDACTRTLMPDSISVMASPNDRRVTPVLVALVLTDRLNMPIELLERMDSGEFDSSPGADRDNIRRIAKLKKRRLTHPQYNVYVIDLDKAVLKQKKFRNENPDYKEGKPCVYVGMTSKTPEARFEQHKRGFKANRFVKKFGIRLRPRDFERHNPMTFEDACKMEIEIARRRKKRGYGVWQK
ncbi:MAG TPA: AAA family ATPase, partial [Nitrospinaceae bacterium]|nr:AAA family ATPase [Nitrospinaceae bacterium]